MSRAWFLQANPKLYDVDAALGQLGEIWWRVPQHTSEIGVNDIAVIWRSGPDAGIVGVGRIVSEPQERVPNPDEQAFILSLDEGEEITRVRLRVRPAAFVGKERLRAIEGFVSHQIVTAPMGTVFPITGEQWAALSPLLPSLPEVASEPEPDLPQPFARAQRAKGVAPVPGGYDGYLATLGRICELVDAEHPAVRRFPELLEQSLGMSRNAASQLASFLRKVGLIVDHAGACRVGPWAERWRRSGDARLVVALLHARCQFIAEMLEAASTPVTTDELLTVARSRYGLAWDTKTQVDNRRGWLQSTGMLAPTGDGRMQTTTAGCKLLDRLAAQRAPGAEPEPPLASAASEATPGPVAAEPDDVVETDVVRDTVDALVEELRRSSTDSANPARFEQSVAAACAFLGFEADWLGGPGRTDVLLVARLDRHDSYRVIVDAKTSASGRVGDHQVDWDTLDEHRAHHEADHVALVAPSPHGDRLFKRAADHGCVVVSVEDLAGLCRLHAKTPLGLDDYRSLFACRGELDSRPVDERADEVERLFLLASAVYQVIRAESQTLGRFTARDTLLLLRNHKHAEVTDEVELQRLLDTMASPLLGILSGDPEQGYRTAMSAAVVELRLDALAAALSGETVVSSQP